MALRTGMQEIYKNQLGFCNAIVAMSLLHTKLFRRHSGERGACLENREHYGAKVESQPPASGTGSDWKLKLLKYICRSKKPERIITVKLLYNFLNYHLTFVLCMPDGVWLFILYP